MQDALITDFHVTDDSQHETIQEILWLESDLSEKEKLQQIKKLHLQLAHASKDQLEKLICRANMMTPDLQPMIKHIVESCDTCIRHQPARPRPVVGLPNFDGFNQTVSMDLHELVPQKLWYLHIVDEFTRYSNACLIKSKKAVPQAFLKNWIQIYGPPGKVFADNGGEFIGESMYELCAAYDINQDNTPGYSPFSNGGCEKQNQILTFLPKLLIKLIFNTYS